MGKEYVAEGLLEAFAAYDLAGKRILLPRAAVARDLVPVELARRGARVDVVEAYRTVVPEDAARAAPLASPSRLHHLHQFLHRAELRRSRRDRGVARDAGASIGPITTQTARDLGIEVTAQAHVFTVEGLVDAILEIVH